MTVPGVGPVVALTYRATVDVPTRFKNSKAIAASFGLTPCKYQSGEIDRDGRISRCGDEMMRVMLYEAAQVMLTRTNKWSWLKVWAMQIAVQHGGRAQMALGWSIAGWDLHPPESAALSRRTPKADFAVIRRLTCDNFLNSLLLTAEVSEAGEWDIGPDVCQTPPRKPLAFNHDRRDGRCDRVCVPSNAAQHATAPDRHGDWPRGRRLL